jgi:hypothetical protein
MVSPRVFVAPQCGGTGELRTGFPGGVDRSNPSIGPEEWFVAFDASDGAFPCQSEKSRGEDSTFFKRVRRAC